MRIQFHLEVDILGILLAWLGTTHRHVSYRFRTQVCSASNTDGKTDNLF
ncbi:MAG TPA: hypothetical protein VFW61_03740 [Acinetobacter sp.]|nr:hypothetical protein [Acinetobacter sp.]